MTDLDKVISDSRDASRAATERISAAKDRNDSSSQKEIQAALAARNRANERISAAKTLKKGL